jgi:predicted transcriptional regulator YdeE
MKYQSMETYVFENDVKVFCLTASSFPAGIKEVYDKLHATYPPGNGRTYFGISYPDGKGSLVYKAAVKLAEGDEEPATGFEQFIIKKGTYISEDIKNFMSDVQRIGRLFQEMIKDPRVDPNGYCLEMYLNPTDVRCMVKLKE